MKINFIKTNIIISATLILTPAFAVAGIYWVDTIGSETKWSNCESTVDPGSGYCSMATANQNATAGDLIILKGGTYTDKDEYIKPVNSGTNLNRITWKNADGEIPLFSGAYPFHLSGVNYHIIDGLSSFETERFPLIVNNSDYNEIRNCNLSTTTAIKGKTGFLIYGKSKHNWIHHNIISNSGYISAGCEDSGQTFDIGQDTGENDSYYNTIEDNTIYNGGHFALRSHVPYNVIRNNWVYNECWMVKDSALTCKLVYKCSDGKNGNRAINVWDPNGVTYMNNLVEGNRIGEAAFAPDGGGADGLTIGSKANIVRFNTIYNSYQAAIYFKVLGKGHGDNNRVYNNTLVHNGHQGDKAGLNWPAGVRFGPVHDNKFHNNLFWDSQSNDDWANYSGLNGCNNCTQLNNYESVDADPLFVDDTIPSSAVQNQPDYSLQATSNAIDGGGFLTQANSSGSLSTILLVEDALFFQDGSWGSSLSSIQADYIAIGTVDNTVQISSINYSTNTIILTAAKTWSDNDKVWLYKDSTGRIVLIGEAPDYGAHEYMTVSSFRQFPPKEFSKAVK